MDGPERIISDKGSMSLQYITWSLENHPMCNIFMWQNTKE